MPAKSIALVILLPSLIVGMVGPPVLGSSPNSRALATEGDDGDDGARDDDGDDRDDDGDESEALRVPEQYLAIQDAIEAAPDDATIKIGPGVYAESLHIEGKQLNLIGSKKARTQLVSRDQTGILTFGGDGGGRLSHLSFSGGDYAIGSDRSGRELPSRIRVRDVSIAGSYRGIYGAFSNLSLRDVSVTGTVWHGMSLCMVEHLDILNAFVSDSQQVGVMVTDCGAEELVIDDSTISNNLGGGVVVVGDINNVAITDSLLTGNHLWGLFTHSVPDPLLIDTTIQATVEGNAPLYEGLADGIIAIDTSLLRLIASTAVSNVRSGILLYGATHGIFSLSDATANRFGLVTQAGGDSCPTWEVFGEEESEFAFGNTEQDILTTCGDLPVPEPPPVPEE